MLTMDLDQTWKLCQSWPSQSLWNEWIGPSTITKLGLRSHPPLHVCKLDSSIAWITCKICLLSYSNPIEPRMDIIIQVLASQSIQMIRLVWNQSSKCWCVCLNKMYLEFITCEYSHPQTHKGKRICFYLLIRLWIH